MLFIFKVEYQFDEKESLNYKGLKIQSCNIPPILEAFKLFVHTIKIFSKWYWWQIDNRTYIYLYVYLFYSIHTKQFSIFCFGCKKWINIKKHAARRTIEITAAFYNWNWNNIFHNQVMILLVLLLLSWNS